MAGKPTIGGKRSDFWDIFSSMPGDFFSQQQTLHTQMIDGQRSSKVVETNFVDSLG